ncbi:hypothetical protein [Sphingobacterium siyangense]|uniref:hypothetical protein n=1 Tax=Sphingobacterium siyangense TaxID=459529 RepID=UPI00196235E2|nr:hypothetical protein [Sphingobacterium siyangense]QRY60512.1 hypothetical protein JVX97_14100 [Sphingobacterium siyangense]
MKKSIHAIFLIILIISLSCFSSMIYGQKYFDLNLSGRYESSTGKYVLQLIQLNPFSYYYEFLPNNIADSLADSNLNSGVFFSATETDDGVFNTGYTQAFQSGFDFKFLDGNNINVNISRFSYDSTNHLTLTGNYLKNTDTSFLKPHYEMFYKKDSFHLYQGAVKLKELFLLYIPMSSNKMKTIQVNKKTRLKIFTTIYHFGLGDMSAKYYYVEVSNGKSIEFGWLDYRDLRKFKLINKTNN